LPNSEITWTPDGAWLVFSATEKGRSDVRRVSLGAGAAETLTGDLPGGARDPSLSPDGKQIAASSGGAIVILGANGGGGEISQPGLRDGFPAWSPNGDRIAFLGAGDPIPGYN
jgi:Tol biopolymer transport system component